jgi:nitrogen fixation NifU-like protein
MTDRSTLDTLYQELILKHYRSSPFRGELPGADVVIPMKNPTCGDELVLQLRLGAEGTTIEEVRFTGHGCAISQAAASMMSEKVVGQTFAAAHPITERFREMIRGDEAAARDRSLGDLRALAGVARLPRRVKCAMLAWDALEEAEKAAGAGGDVAS